MALLRATIPRRTAEPIARRVLLLGADHYGTLAAARSYARNGVTVALADESTSARACYSRFAGETLVHPSLASPADLVAWLVRFGDEHPGTLLYPPNDHLAWLFAEHRDVLSRAFRTYAPGEPSIIALLDKSRLHAACAAVGIDVPATYAAASVRSGRLSFPVLVKPRTQIYFARGIKGFIAHEERELGAALARFARLVQFHEVLVRRYPDITEPIVQEYLAAAETSILSISGFITHDGQIVTRAAMKVLQRPRKVGIGLCFEGRPVEDALLEKVRALCAHVGYFGAFESEFIVNGDRRLLIDFNPRLYSQLGFDIARGLPLPMLVWHAACGDRAKLDEELVRAGAWRPAGNEAYCHKTMLDVVLVLQGLSGAMSRAEVASWREWYAAHHPTDAVRDPDDRMPALIDALAWAAHFARHPRSFVRSFVLNR